MKKKIIICSALLIILILSFIVRYKGITFGFPLIVHPDEPKIAVPASRMVITGDLNPHTFLYPSLYYYLQAAVYFTVIFLGKIFGIFTSMADVSITTIYYWGRMLTIIMSVATIYLTYLVTSRLYNRESAIAAAAFVAASCLHVMNSFMITTDSPMAFWIMAAFFMSVLIYQDGPKTKYFILNGIFVGFATGTKYTAIFCVIPMLLAHFFQGGFSVKKIWHKGFVLGMLAVPVSFVCSTPYLVINFSDFWGYIQFQKEAYSGGHAGAEGGLTSYDFYFDALVKNYGIIPLTLGALGAVFSFSKDWKKASFFISFPAIYFFFMGSYKVRFDRNIVCLIPFLGTLGGVGLVAMVDLVKNRLSSAAVKYIWASFLICFVAFGIFQQTDKSLKFVHGLTLPDTRWISKLWIEKNIPFGSRVGRELYTPPIDPGLFVVEELSLTGLLWTNLWKFDYFIASSADYDRFLKNEKAYPERAQRYKQIFAIHKLVKEFRPDDKTGGPVIRVYKVK